MEAGKYYGFNEVGTRIWEYIQDPRTVDEICEFVLTEYEIDEQRCRNDVRRLLSELLENDLVQLVE